MKSCREGGSALWGKKRTRLLTPASSYFCVNCVACVRAMLSKHKLPASPKAFSPPLSHSPSPAQPPAHFSVPKLETLCKSYCRGRPAELCPRNPLRPPHLSKCLGDCTSQQTQLAASTAGAHPTSETSEAVSPPGDLTLSTPA